MKSNNWLKRQKKDIFLKKAKKEGYINRSAYKLIEIEKKFKLIVKSNNILELGAAPGGWSQVICRLNKNVKIDAFDLLNMKYKHKNINFTKIDFTSYNFKNNKKKYDLILSDAAPNTSGNKSTDHLKIIQLIEKMLLIVKITAMNNCNIIFKIWSGSENKDLISKIKNNFEKVNFFKPKSSRKESSEIYIIAKNYFEFD